MLIFRGGLTEEQVEKFRRGEYIIQSKVKSSHIILPFVNTFEYVDRSKTYVDNEDMQKYISEDTFKQQYVFFFKYINNAMNFKYKGKYLMIADIKEDILNKYIGCGIYYDTKFQRRYRIEYRIPRRFITIDDIYDIISLDKEAHKIIKQKYSRYFSNKYIESFKAKKLMRDKNLQMNGDKEFLMQKKS